MKIIYIFIAVAILAVAGFIIFNNSSVEDNSGKIIIGENNPIIQPNNQEETIVEDSNWRNIELKNIATQESFKISDFSDKPILLESFAVWCPTCTRQQKEIKNLHNDIGEVIISISIDTDPNEDEAKVLNHINSNGFDWRYAISPENMTQRLRDEFGLPILNAPQAPVVLICPGEQEARLLNSGVKKSNELKQELETC
jgi:thiol-disulfide isomerase/thioredoxin